MSFTPDRLNRRCGSLNMEMAILKEVILPDCGKLSDERRGMH